MKKILTTIFASLALTASAQYGKYVGGDISLLPEYETHNSGYLDGDGKKIDDLLLWFKDECGWNTFRVRLFVNPTNQKHDGTVQNLDYVRSLGKRIKDAGANFVLDFHYSDTWVDALNIQAPESCKSMTVDEKAAWIYDYTRKTLTDLTAAGAKPDLVQVGNEIMYGFMGITVAPYDGAPNTDWDSYLKVLGQGCKAVREVCPDAQIIIHTDRPTNLDYNKYYYSKLVNANIDFDVIGLSFYPFWHGYITKAQNSKANGNLETALNDLKLQFPGKKVQIVETAYNFQYWPSSGVNTDTRKIWGATADGQYKFIKDLIAELANHDNVEGLYYWFPEEAGCGDDTNWNAQSYGTVLTTWLNRGFWWEDVTQNGHWPVKAADGMTPYLFKSFLSPAASSIRPLSSATTSQSNAIYTISGQRVTNPSTGIYIKDGKKYIVKVQ